MTKQESFKTRVRARMSKTGERYGAARRALIEASSRSDRRWVSHPETSDDAVRQATGRGWDQWCDLVDAWPGPHDDHSAIVGHIIDDHGIQGWWAQTIAVGYGRITGRRLPHQRPDGTFNAGRSRTIRIDPDELRGMLLDDEARTDLFPGFDTELRSKATTKTLRVRIGPGIALFNLEPRDDGRVTVTVSHERLESPEEVEEWKHYWGEWLRAIDDG